MGFVHPSFTSWCCILLMMVDRIYIESIEPLIPRILQREPPFWKGWKKSEWSQIWSWPKSSLVIWTNTMERCRRYKTMDLVFLYPQGCNNQERLISFKLYFRCHTTLCWKLAERQESGSECGRQNRNWVFWLDMFCTSMNVHSLGLFMNDDPFPQDVTAALHWLQEIDSASLCPA